MTLDIFKISKRSRNTICFFFVLRKNRRVIEILGFMYKPAQFDQYRNLGVVFLNVLQIKYWLSLKAVKVPLWFHKFILPFLSTPSFSNFLTKNRLLQSQLTLQSHFNDFAKLVAKEPSKIFYNHSFILKLWLSLFLRRRFKHLNSNANLFQKKI